MLKLFQSIFGGSERHGRYPESLIEMAIERAVDGTYPRLRAAPGYRKRLREPVIHAIDHVITLVDTLPAPLIAASSEYAKDFRLPALFVSPQHLREVFGNDLVISDFRENHPTMGERATALLLAERKVKNTLGIELEGEMLRRDVAQVSVSFSNHRLVDAAVTEDEARRLLKRRAFDHLISLALWRISEAKGERAELNQQRELLRSKLGILQRSGWSFESQATAPTSDTALQTELEEIEAQLAALSVDERSLNGQLDIVTDVLSAPAKQFWSEPVELHLDRMNIKRDAQNPDARLICFHELHNTRGQCLVASLVSIDPAELPERTGFIANANRLLV